MTTYHLLFFGGHRLDRSEDINAETQAEAVEQAAQQAGSGHAELWWRGGKVATFEAPEGSFARKIRGENS